MKMFRQASQWDYRWLLGRSESRYSTMPIDLPATRGTGAHQWWWSLNFDRLGNLHRGNGQTASRRHQQAQLLNEWARTQTLPLVLTGIFQQDAGFDFNPNQLGAGLCVCVAQN
ncbi:MAG: hypothetical protein RMI89_07050 [Gloeomargarita sp. SKYBB_i_bin120]|nr:hypothetical protein [Gloeomargarita sp. SKYB120]MDW8178279.1 hypothetical protein [Gloeomargarita sp. SKYBB_i_bin120]